MSDLTRCESELLLYQVEYGYATWLSLGQIDQLAEKQRGADP